MTYLASHPGVAMWALESLNFFGKERYSKGEPLIYEPATIGPRKEGIAEATGQSIAEKRAAICAKFEALKNTRREPGHDMRYVEALEKTFERTFEKATSGYRKGGLWDGVWRYSKQPGKWMPHYLVGNQIHEKDIDQLTPSAKRFALILDQLIEALERGRQSMEASEQVRALHHPSSFAERAGTSGQRGDPVETAEHVCRLVDISQQSCELARQALEEASGQVWPDKKHYGKRQILSFVLASVATAIAILGLAISAPILSCLGVTMTAATRGVGLASIRGFDRERSWKAIEGLLDATKQFITLEGDTMKTDVSLAQLRSTARLFEGQENLRMRIDDAQANLRGGQENLSVRIDDARESLKGGQENLSGKLDEFREELRRVAIAAGVYAATSNVTAPSAPSSAPSSESSSVMSSTTATPVGTPPKPHPPMLRTQSLQTFTASPTRFA